MLFISHIIACVFLSLHFVTNAKELQTLPPAAGCWVIQNAQSGLFLTISSSGKQVVESAPLAPILSNSTQIWNFIPISGTAGSIQSLAPSSFINCPTLVSGETCVGDTATTTPLIIFPIDTGAFVITPVAGLSITGTGAQSGEVFLSPTTFSLNQVWLLAVPQNAACVTS